MIQNLLKIEWTKLVNYTSFKVILVLHLALFSLVIFVSSQANITIPGFDTSNFFRFPHVWSFFAWIASWFNLLLAILLIMITGNEFAYRTFRQHVIDGLDRSHLLTGKLLVVILISCYGLILVFISGAVYGTIFTQDLSISLFFSGSGILLIYFLQALAYMTAGLVFAMLLRSTALSIILFILFRFPFEPIIRSFFSHAVRPFFPMKAIGGLTPTPEVLTITSGISHEAPEGNVPQLTLEEIGLVSPGLPLFGQILVVTGYIILFLSIILYSLKRRDL